MILGFTALLLLLLCGCAHLWVCEVVQCCVGLDASSQHGVKHSIVSAPGHNTCSNC